MFSLTQFMFNQNVFHSSLRTLQYTLSHQLCHCENTDHLSCEKFIRQYLLYSCSVAMARIIHLSVGVYNWIAALKNRHIVLSYDRVILKILFFADVGSKYTYKSVLYIVQQYQQFIKMSQFLYHISCLVVCIIIFITDYETLTNPV